MHRVFRALCGVLVFTMLAGCGDSETATRNRVLGIGGAALRKDSGKLNRDYFGAPGGEFYTLKKSAWPKTFSEMKALRVTLYRDGASLALGGSAGTNEWGIFVMPPGLDYAPPSTAVIRYEAIEKGVYFYRNVP